MGNDYFFCKHCEKVLNDDSKFCPFCGNKRKGFMQKPLFGFTILYVMSLIGSISFGVIGYLVYSSQQALAGALYSMAAALGPVSILGIIYDKLLKNSLKDAALTSFSDLSRNVCSHSIDEIGKQKKGLENLTKRIMEISEVGLKAALPERRYAFKYIEEAILSEEKEIYIVGTSFRGLLWPSEGEERLMKAISDRIKNSNCKVRFILTHPAFVHLRQSLEIAQRKVKFHIAQEILETVKILRDAGVSHENIRFVKGTPTIFGIMTSSLMLLNPYPYQMQAYTSATFVIDSENGENRVYRSFEQSHFKGVWKGKNVEELNGFEIIQVQEVFDKSLHKMKLCESNMELDYKQYEKANN